MQALGGGKDVGTGVLGERQKVFVSTCANYQSEGLC